MVPERVQAVVHDLKNALGVLEAELERLVCLDHLEAVRPAYAHCADLRQRLLGFLLLSSTADGHLAARIDAHGPDDVLRHARAGFVVPPGGPEITLTVTDGCPPVWFFDSRLIDLALHAALANAVGFARSRIVLGAARSTDGLLFFVEDDGPGFGAAATPGGSGLGMALCGSVARAHRNGERCGRVVLGASTLGGARFELHLP